eukprot:268041-Pleurochrysis_carterae.AAC.4
MRRLQVRPCKEIASSSVVCLILEPRIDACALARLADACYQCSGCHLLLAERDRESGKVGQVTGLAEHEALRFKKARRDALGAPLAERNVPKLAGGLPTARHERMR